MLAERTSCNFTNSFLGHADIAPGNKQDPGILFPWSRLYTEFGVGAWLDDDERTEQAIVQKYRPPHSLPSQVDVRFFLARLVDFGYNLPETLNLTANGGQNSAEDNNYWAQISDVVKAFRGHFSGNSRPETYDHKGVTEIDQFWAWALTAKYKLMKN